MSNIKKLLFALPLLLLPTIAFGFTGPVDLVGASLDKSLAVVMNDLETMAMTILFSLSLLQFIIIGYMQIQSGEIEASIAKFAKAFIWVAFCVWLLSPNGTGDGLSNGGHFMRSTFDTFLKLAGSWTVLQGGSFDTSSVLLTGLNAYGAITLSVLKATSTNVANALVTLFVPGVSFLTALMVFTISLFIIIACSIIAIEVFLVKLEASIVIAISPLSMSFLGLNALRDQGFAPFKSILALIYRVVILGAVVSSIGTVSKYLSDYVDNQAYGIVADVFSPLIAATFAFCLLAVLAYKSKAISASLANGSASLGPGDIASAVAAGVAGVAAGAAGGAAAAETAGKAGQTMGDFIKSLSTDGGSISNASGSGQGGFSPESLGPAPVAPPKPPEMSLQEMRNHPSAIGNRKEPSPVNLAGIPQTPSGSSSPSSTKPSSQPVSGSGSTAGIGGASSGTDQKLDKLIDSMSKPAQKPSFGDRLSTLNDHVAREQAATHVSINTHHD